MTSAVFFAVAASLGYGASDFMAGRASRRLDPAAVVLLSEGAQAAVLLAFAVHQSFPAVAFGWAVAAGAVNALGLVLYYRALGSGPAGVVAPLVASSTAVPAAVAVVGGTLMGPLTLAGLAAVIGGVVVGAAGADQDASPCEAGSPCRGASRPRDGARAERSAGPPPGARGYVGVAVLAALALGTFFVLLDRGAMAAMMEGRLWVPLGVQLGALPLVAGRVLAARRSGGLSMPGRADLPALAGLAALNLTGDVALARALAAGDLGVVAVLASLGPAVTGLLARGIERERLTRRQALGAALTLAGVVAVTAGG